jgi:hypothetical protein
MPITFSFLEPDHTDVAEAALRSTWRLLRAVDSPLTSGSESSRVRGILLSRIEEKIGSGIRNIDELRADALTFIHRVELDDYRRDAD